MKLYQTFLALAVLTLLCANCKEDEPTPATPDIDLTGTWQIRVNDWHKHSATERFGQDIFPGTFEFDEYRDVSGSGTLSYSIDGDQIEEPFTYQVTVDTLIILLSRLPDNKTASYRAEGYNETELYLTGVTETVDQATGLMEVLTEEMVVIR